MNSSLRLVALRIPLACTSSAGVMWIGHLWYFNFTQTPTMPKIPAELKPGVAKYILPEALFWFRWGAMATIVTGLIASPISGMASGPQAIDLGIGDDSPHVHYDRLRHVAGHDHVVQRLVHHLAESEEASASFK